jgi:hypothetical protein
MKRDGINALMGIIPIPDQYDINHNATRINTVYTIDHYAYPSGNKPEKSKRVRGPIIPEVGSIYKSNGALPYKPSYSKIGMETVLSDPDNYDVKHTILIDNNSVFFNNHCIAIAPEKHNNGKKFTGAQKTQFCKAVVYGIIPGYINKIIDKKDVSVPDDLYFRELIAQYPAISAPQKEADIMPVDLVLPEHLNAYTPDALTGYPGNDIAMDAIFMASLNDDVERDNLETTLNEELSDMIADEPLNLISLEPEYNKNEESELYNLINPKIIKQWTHGSMIIQECVIA